MPTVLPWLLLLLVIATAAVWWVAQDDRWTVVLPDGERRRFESIHDARRAAQRAAVYKNAPYIFRDGRTFTVSKSPEWPQRS